MSDGLAALEELTHRLDRRDRLIVSILKAQHVFIRGESYAKAFDLFLETLLDFTGSEYGFIGEIRTDKVNPYLKTFAITNIAWNKETRQFYEDNAPDGLEFHKLSSLFGRTVQTGEVVIANDPKNHPYAAGIPEGHPPLKAYLGMPLVFEEKMIGMFGIANREGGYSQSLADELLPLCESISNFIFGYQYSRGYQ